MVETRNKKQEQEVHRGLQGGGKNKLCVRVDWMKGFKEAMNEAINKVGRVTRDHMGLKEASMPRWLMSSEPRSIGRLGGRIQGQCINKDHKDHNRLPGSNPHGIRLLLSFPAEFSSSAAILEKYETDPPVQHVRNKGEGGRRRRVKFLQFGKDQRRG